MYSFENQSLSGIGYIRHMRNKRPESYEPFLFWRSISWVDMIGVYTYGYYANLIFRLDNLHIGT